MITQEERDRRIRVLLLNGMKGRYDLDRGGRDTSHPMTLDQLLKSNFLAKSMFNRMSKEAQTKLREETS